MVDRDNSSKHPRPALWGVDSLAGEDIYNQKIWLAVYAEGRTAHADPGTDKQMGAIHYEMALVETPAIARRDHQRAEAGRLELTSMIMTGEHRRQAAAAQPVNVIRSM